MKEQKRFPFEPFTKEWERQADEVARIYAPTIYPCAKCGAPVVTGYCCCFCGDTNPSSKSRD